MYQTISGIIRTRIIKTTRFGVDMVLIQIAPSQRFRVLTSATRLDFPLAQLVPSQSQTPPVLLVVSNFIPIGY